MLVFKIEIALLLLCLGSMLCVRWFRNWRQWLSNRQRKKLEQIFTDAILNQQILHIDHIAYSLRNYKNLLLVIEMFDRDFLDTVWLETKKNLIEEYLIQRAEKLIQSSRWRKRQFGLRCYNMDPKRAIKKDVIGHLLNDDHYIIRILAATIMVHAEQKELLLAVLHRMIKESVMARYSYRDLLINSGELIFDWLEEIASQESNLELVAICLDILSKKISHNLIPLAIKSIDSANFTCRFAAIEIFSNIPGDESIKYLTASLSDENKEIRALAAQGLGRIFAISAIPQLSLALQDPEWFVRLQAAHALKLMGEEGWAALYQQNKEQSPAAYEIARYILAIS